MFLGLLLLLLCLLLFFFFNDTATTEIYTLSLHDALPISSINALATNKLYLLFFYVHFLNFGSFHPLMKRIYLISIINTRFKKLSRAVTKPLVCNSNDDTVLSSIRTCNRLFSVSYAFALQICSPSS